MKALDFDIEGDKVRDQASIRRRNLALVALRAANPGLTLSYFRFCRSGGLGVLTSAKRDGFSPDIINVLAMNYGASVDNGGQMGRDALTAASNAVLQEKAAGLTSRVGVPPMIGVNDVSGEVFTLEDALCSRPSPPPTPILGACRLVRRPRQRLLRRLHQRSPDLQWHQSPYAFSAIFKGQ